MDEPLDVSNEALDDFFPDLGGVLGGQLLLPAEDQGPVMVSSQYDSI
jgi:hypothetical protein